MKHFSRFILAFVAGLVVFLGVMYLFDGEEMNWRKNLIVGSVTMAFTIAGLYIFRTKGE